MQIESLKIFCDGADTKSFTGAAQLNGINESAVSQSVKSLELRFKSALVLRNKHGFHLTIAGQAVYDFSKQILQACQMMEARITEAKQAVSGNLRLATVSSVGLHWLPPRLKKFQDTAPSARVHVQYRRSDQVYEEVLSGAADLGLVAYPVSQPRLKIVALGKEPQVLICPPNHRLAKLNTISLKSLGGETFVGLHRGTPSRNALDKILREENVAMKQVVEVGHLEMIMRLVEIGSGIAIMPEAMVRQRVASGALAAVRLDGDYSQPLGAVYRKNTVISVAMEQFIDLLKEPLQVSP